MRILRLLVIPGILAAFSLQAYASKTFSNQFVEFELPNKWECQLDGTEWVCQSTDEQKKRDAIIVLAAKIAKAGMDSMEAYEAHLKKKQIYQSLSGDTIESTPRYTKNTTVHGQTWVDALHLQSEIPDFYTRYLATVVQDLGVLVTFSVRKDKYNEYAPDIDALVKSLKAFRKPGDINLTSGESTGTEVYGGDTTRVDQEGQGPKGPKSEGARGVSDGAKTAIGLGFLLLLIGAYIFIRKKMRK